MSKYSDKRLPCFLLYFHVQDPGDEYPRLVYMAMKVEDILESSDVFTFIFRIEEKDLPKNIVKAPDYQELIQDVYKERDVQVDKFFFNKRIDYLLTVGDKVYGKIP